MEGRHPKPDAYRSNVGPRVCRRCRVSLIFQEVTSTFFSAIATPTRYAGRSGIVQDALGAARSMVTLCDAFANVELPAAGKHEIPGLDGVF
jgi:hypothetical protein